MSIIVLIGYTCVLRVGFMLSERLLCFWLWVVVVSFELICFALLGCGYG